MLTDYSLFATGFASVFLLWRLAGYGRSGEVLNNGGLQIADKNRLIRDELSLETLGELCKSQSVTLQDRWELHIPTLASKALLTYMTSTESAIQVLLNRALSGEHLPFLIAAASSADPTLRKQAIVALSQLTKNGTWSIEDFFCGTLTGLVRGEPKGLVRVWVIKGPHESSYCSTRRCCYLSLRGHINLPATFHYW